MDHPVPCAESPGRKEVEGTVSRQCHKLSEPQYMHDIRIMWATNQMPQRTDHLNYPDTALYPGLCFPPMSNIIVRRSIHLDFQKYHDPSCLYSLVSLSSYLQEQLTDFCVSIKLVLLALDLLTVLAKIDFD